MCKKVSLSRVYDDISPPYRLPLAFTYRHNNRCNRYRTTTALPQLIVTSVSESLPLLLRAGLTRYRYFSTSHTHLIKSLRRGKKCNSIHSLFIRSTTEKLSLHNDTFPDRCHRITWDNISV